MYYICIYHERERERENFKCEITMWDLNKSGDPLIQILKFRKKIFKKFRKNVIRKNIIDINNLDSENCLLI